MKSVLFWINASFLSVSLYVCLSLNQITKLIIYFNVVIFLKPFFWYIMWLLKTFFRCLFAKKICKEKKKLIPHFFLFSKAFNNKNLM